MSAEDRPIEVVAAAIVRDGSVLAAHRRHPPGWEFPGGKVEPGESAIAALRRECREELDVDVEPGPVLGAAADGRISLTVLAATLGAGEPRAGADHDELRWLTPDELEDPDALDWLPLDRALLGDVAAYLTRHQARHPARCSDATLREMNRPGRL